MRLQTILVPLDGSALAEQALPQAVDIARRAGARLHLVSIVAHVAIDGAGLPVPIALGLDRERERYQAYVDEMVGRLRVGEGVQATGEVLLDSPIDGILQAITARDADLVVMTAHGRGGFTRFWLGSVADGVARRAPVPVLVRKPDDDLRHGLLKRPLLRRILVPVNGSLAAEAAFGPARQLSSLFDAPITLLLVLESGLTLSPEFPPYGVQVDPVVLFERREQAARYLERAAAGLRAAGIDVATAISEDIGVAQAITDFATRNRFDLTVMSTHGRGGLRRLLVGSVADKALRSADVPVLLVRPTEVRQPAAREGHPAWEREMVAFTDRNAMRPAVVEVDTVPGGAQREVQGLQLTGVYYDPRDDQFGVTLRGSGSTHLTHAVRAPSRIDVLNQGHRDVLAVRHDEGQTLILVTREDPETSGANDV